MKIILKTNQRGLNYVLLRTGANRRLSLMTTAEYLIENETLTYEEANAVQHDHDEQFVRIIEDANEEKALRAYGASAILFAILGGILGIFFAVLGLSSDYMHKHTPVYLTAIGIAVAEFAAIIALSAFF